MKQKVTILLGAGFAQYLGGLSTNDINEAFKADQNIKVGNQCLYEYIESQCKEKKYSLNFESFFALIENYLFYKHGIECLTEAPNNTDILSILFTKSILDSIPELTTARGCFSTYNHYMKLLIKIIESYNNLEEGRNEKIKQFANFISKLKKEYKQIKIYTTNYDTIVPDYFNNDIETGIINGVFQYNLNNFKKSKLSFFSLHGNIYISREKYNIIKQNKSYTLLPQYAMSSGGGDIGRINLFTPIISGYNKLSHANGKPFNFGFHAFTNDCEESETIITMGFSFKDTHISSILATFHREGTKVISVDKTNVLPIPTELINNKAYEPCDLGIEYFINNYKSNIYV